MADDVLCDKCGTECASYYNADFTDGELKAGTVRCLKCVKVRRAREFLKSKIILMWTGVGPSYSALVQALAAYIDHHEPPEREGKLVTGSELSFGKAVVGGACPGGHDERWIYNRARR